MTDKPVFIFSTSLNIITVQDYEVHSTCRDDPSFSFQSRFTAPYRGPQVHKKEKKHEEQNWRDIKRPVSYVPNHKEVVSNVI